MALDSTQYIQKFAADLTSRRRARATIVAYTKDVGQMFEFLSHAGIPDIKQVTQDHLIAYIKKMQSDNLTPKSISRKINSMKTMFRFLKAQGIVADDPAGSLDHPKFECKPPRILTKLEYRALRDACRDDARIYAIVELFLQTGIRIGELANLAVEDIKDTELFIRAQEGHDERTVPLNKAAKNALDEYLKVRTGNGKSNALFVTKTGKQLLVRNIRTSIDRYFRVAGIEGAKVNDLRHTFIAHHLMAGASVASISKLVGHKRSSTTEKYMDLIKNLGQEKMKVGEL